MKSVVKIIVIFTFAACGNTPRGIELVADNAQRKVDVLYDGKLFTSYIYPADLEKTALYPVCTAHGTVITRGYPRDPRPNDRIDHPHHVGAWFTFGDVNGVDFWGTSSVLPAERRPLYGEVRHTGIVSAQSGVNQATLVVTTDWVDFYEKLLLKEETTFVFRGEDDWRIVERTTVLTACQDTVTFTDNKEGMIAIRMDRAFEEPSDQPGRFVDADGIITEVKVLNNEGVNGVYRNSEGFEKGDVWGKPTKWVSLSAEKAGEKISVAIVDHKDNPGYPAHSHARGYGLFSTNNMGAQAFNEEASQFKLMITRGQTTTFKHLMAVKTNGFVTDDEMNQLFAAFNK